jgi:hypothetical protein
MAGKPTSVNKLISGRGPLRHWLEDIRAQTVLLEQVRERLPSALRPHCISARRDGDTLVVFADSAVWATRLRYEVGRVLIPLSVRNLRVRVAPPSPEAQQPKKARPVLPASAAAVLAETAAYVADPALAASMMRLAARHGLQHEADEGHSEPEED